ncbi:WD repeat-containing protein 75-like [Anneissia japonica]|uniref:WD repeat-containing protein 75-like n=1 Tax=Anneissia japonica TaxID=1529436 RepID=UPI001425ADCF|nr:WD repeat-containing protein 75-like [Anneissia japonica]
MADTCATSMEPCLVQRGGRKFVQERTIFSKDSKYLLCCSGNAVSVYSTASGECVQTLTSHQDAVTGIQLNHSNHLQVFSCSVDGTVKQWDFPDGILLKTYKLPSPVLGLLTSPAHLDVIFVVAKPKSRQKQTLELSKFKLSKATAKTVKADPSILMSNILSNSRTFAFGAHGKFIASVQEHILRIYFIKSKKFIRLKEQHRKFTCVACHPTELCIAAGDNKGRIHYYRNFTDENSVIKSMNHWHSLRVEDLCFTSEGSYLFSVGHECTLVQWQYNTNHKDFLPRLLAPISHVTSSPDNQIQALSLFNNVILLVSNNRVVKTIQGLNYGHLQQQQHPPCHAGMTFDPRTKALVLNGKVGHIQFYQVEEDRALFNLDIVGQNYISPDSLDKPLIHTDVDLMAFSQDGQWLATIESRDDGQTSSELRLKFWCFDEQKDSFTLNTNVENPHLGKITSLCFKPSPSNQETTPTAVTASDEGQFKVWTLVDDSDIYRNNQCWNCHSVGFYRNLPCGYVCFASDGSLLAVAFSQVITIWDPTTNVLKTTLSHGSKYPIRKLQFGHGDSSHLLVSTTATTLCVWNLLTCSMSWNVCMEVTLLLCDPLSQYWIAIDSAKTLYVFEANSPKPAMTHPKFIKSQVINGIFIPRLHALPKEENEDVLPWQHNSQLYLMTKKQELHLVVSRQEAEREEKRNADRVRGIQENLPATPFSMFIEQSKGNTLNLQEMQESSKLHGNPSSEAIKNLLSAPAHVLPPVKTLCASFIKAHLPRIQDIRDQIDMDQSEGEEENEDEKEDDSDIEEEGMKVKTNYEDMEMINEMSQLDVKEWKKLSKLTLADTQWLGNVLGKDLK